MSVIEHYSRARDPRLPVWRQSLSAASAEFAEAGLQIDRLPEPPPSPETEEFFPAS